VCFLISAGATIGLGIIISDSYSCYDVEIIDGEPMKLFGPKAPNDLDWEYEDRFRYKPWKKTINV